MIMVDFDQIEMRQLAVLSDDPALIKAFDAGDFFTTMTRAIYRDETITKNDPRRQRYLELLSTINGWSAPESLSPALDWFLDALRLRIPA